MMASIVATLHITRETNVKTYRLGLGLATLALVGVLVGNAQTTLPADDAKEIIAHEINYLQTELAKPKILKKADLKIRQSALMLASAAESVAGKEETSAAALRNKALDVIKAMEKKDLGEAKKIADGLSDKLPPEKISKDSLKDPLDLLGLMKMFNDEKIGGFGLELSLDELLEFKGPLEAEQADKIAHLGRKIAIIAELSNHHGPETDDGKKTKKAWDSMNVDMHKAALDLAHAGQAKQGDHIGQLADSLSQTCLRCHDVFRKKD
jgi:hypothetical protein